MPGATLARNSFINLLGHLLPLGVAAVAIPIVLNGLGPPRFGVLALIWSLLGRLNLADLGIGRAATRYVAEALGEGDDHRAADLAWTAFVVQIALSLLAGAVAFLLAPWLAETVFRVPEELVPESTGAFRMMGIGLPAVMLWNATRPILEAAQRFGVLNAVRVPLNAAGYLVPWIGVWLDWSLPVIVLGIVASRLVGGLVQGAFCLRTFPLLRSYRHVESGLIAELLRFGGWATVSSVVSPILVYADRILIGIGVGMAAVAFYTAPYEILMRMLIVPASIVATLFPALSAGAGAGRAGRNDRLVSRSVKFTLLALAPAAAIAAAFAGPILRLWIGAEVADASTLVVQILAGGVLVNAVAYSAYAALHAADRPDIPARIHLLELPLHLALLWFGLREWGIAGAAAAWTVRAAIDAALLYGAGIRAGILSRRVLTQEGLRATTALLAAVAAVILGLATADLGTALTLLLLATTAAVALAVAWHRLISVHERQQIRRAFRGGSAA